MVLLQAAAFSAVLENETRSIETKQRNYYTAVEVHPSGCLLLKTSVLITE